VKDNNNFEKFLDSIKGVLFKQRGQDVDLNTIIKNFGMAVVLIGRPEVVMNYGYKPYLRYICRTFKKENINIFYLLARGDINISIANKVVKELKRTKIVNETNRYESEIAESKPTKHILIRIQIKENNTKVKEALNKITKECSNNYFEKQYV